MSTIIGLHGRQYDSRNGKRIETVHHEERRTPEQLREARAAAAAQNRREHDYGLPVDSDPNPIRRVIREHTRIKGEVWRRSEAGRKWLIEKSAEADAWDQQRAAEVAEHQRQASIADLVAHAEAQAQQVFDDPTESVEATERASAALEAAKRGDRSAYLEWERARNEQRTQRLAEQLAAKQIDIDKMRAERDAILQSALDYQPTPVPTIRQPEPSIEVDRSKRAVTRRIPVDGGGYREVTEIVDAD